jgi:hypothetical protein
MSTCSTDRLSAMFIRDLVCHKMKDMLFPIVPLKTFPKNSHFWMRKEVPLLRIFEIVRFQHDLGLAVAP